MSGGGSSKKVTVGYRYYLGMHMAVAAAMDDLLAVRIGEKEAWSGAVAGGRISISEPGLFGGDDREGGVVGDVDILPGGCGQGVNDYLAGKLGGVAFRGFVSAVLRQVLIATNNPYLKPWSWLIRARACVSGGWYPDARDIGIHDINPAHVIRSILTGVVLPDGSTAGLGIPASDLDDASFRVAADILAGEGFGVSFIWREETEEEFILEVLRHVDGVLYVDPVTGLFTLKLARAEHDEPGVTLDPSNIISLETFRRPSWSEVVNELVVSYVDRNGTSRVTAPMQDTAAIVAAGRVNSETINYPGVAEESLALKLAERDLRQLSSCLARVELNANRAAGVLRPGMTFTLSWPPLGLESIPMRALEVDLGTLGSGRVKILACEDAFRAGQAIYVSPNESLWESPVNKPAPCALRHLAEAPYYVLVKEVTGENPALISGYDEMSGVLTVQAARPSADSSEYVIKVVAGQAGGSPTGTFSPTATLAGAVTKTTKTVTITGDLDLDYVEEGDLAYLGDEAVLVTAAPELGLATLARGVLDTVPVAHPAGERLWFLSTQGIDPTERLSGDPLAVALLPRTSLGELDQSLAPVDWLDLRHRAIRPYPPGRVRINGQEWPAEISGDLVLTWAHRSRTQQTAYVVEQDEGNIGPESGQTYSLNIFGDQDALIHAERELGGTGYTFTRTAERAATGGRLNQWLRLELYSERDGYESWQRHVAIVTRTDANSGYGYQYGQDYGR